MMVVQEKVTFILLALVLMFCCQMSDVLLAHPPTQPAPSADFVALYNIKVSDFAHLDHSLLGQLCQLMYLMLSLFSLKESLPISLQN